MAKETELENALRRAIVASDKTNYALAQTAGVDERGLGRFIEGATIRSDTAGKLMAALNLEVRPKKK